MRGRFKMARLPIINPEKTTGKSQELLTAIGKNIRIVPDMARVMVNSPRGFRSVHRFQRHPGWWQCECKDPGTHMDLPVAKPLAAPAR
jgi:hypothetical protein